MRKLLKYLPILFITLMIFEDAEARGTSSRRRRKQRECESQLAKIADYKVDCSSILRTRYIDLIIRNEKSSCFDARSAVYDDIPAIAKESKYDSLVLQQCFGENLEFATTEERSHIQSEKSRIAQEAKESFKNGLQILGLVTLIAIILLFIF